jgi:hypothetical protein
MDFSNYKFVVSSGCSYGRLADYVFNIFDYLIEGERLRDEYGQVDWLNLNGDRVISLNVSLGSQGSDWQTDSLIYVVDELLKLGVKSENIFCLIEWSQWDRFSIHPPHHYGLDLKLLDFRDFSYESIIRNEFEYHFLHDGIILDKLESNTILNFFREHLNLYRSSAFQNVGKIQDKIYMMVNHLNPENFETLGGDYKLFYDDIIEVINRIPLENKITNFLNNILRAQYYLEKNKLSYNFCFMQSTLSDWEFMKNSVIGHPLFNIGMNPYFILRDKIVVNQQYNPINNPNSDIEKIMPEIKCKVDQINFENFWFYETDKFRRGGIDEWALDNFKETGYVNITHGKLDLNFSFDEIVPNYGEHPNMVAYILLWNKVTFNCNFVKVKPEFEKFIWEKYMEDYNYDGITKHNITLSKKEWDRITKFDKPS